MNAMASINTRKAVRMIQRGVLEIFSLVPGGPLTHRVRSKHHAARAARAFAKHGCVAAPITRKAHLVIKEQSRRTVPASVFASAVFHSKTPNFPYLNRRYR